MLDEEVTDYKEKIQKTIDALDGELRELALNIHAHPEISFEEFQAMEWLTDTLAKEGFEIEKGIAGLETAFIASWTHQKEGPTIAFLAEYDALPRLGHGCGHNLIGTASVGAAIALKKAFPELPGKLFVIGTPAEEEGGGKIIMANHGVFDAIDAVMMCHPRNQTVVLRGGLACVDAVVKFYGKESHASSAPEKGISALDAVINSFNAIHSLRAYLPREAKVNGIITKGGDATNIVPGFCEAKFLMRAVDTIELNRVRDKVYRAIKGASESVGATCEVEEGLIYAERNNNEELAELFRQNLVSMGIEVEPAEGGIGSSDIGNVGQVTATIHPYIKIGEADNHTPAFVEEAKSETGLKGMNQAAKALAMTAFDLCTDQAAYRRVRSEYEQWKARHSHE
ncbi:amidohydrolase [Pullulanibacillus camelliae]|uniref:Peptidase M20 domain-containing protein 2 n=1 Tax=Pullulanibacillus camelliae TaxID=1707096 RepID=A0A8J2VLW6_9BACL|nr:M20 family metallopeptidase [Pullulanibacillus camelliae]GGE31711.1 amidohydrolase [Pullulanibacillus camelliae]